MWSSSSRSWWHLVMGAMQFTEQEIMLVVLGLIDVVMISNLLIMVIVGGYETFVSRMELRVIPTSRSGCPTSTPAC